MPSLDTLEALAVALGVTPAWLAYGLGSREAGRHRLEGVPLGATGRSIGLPFEKGAK